jgi:hypothetical protein
MQIATTLKTIVTGNNGEGVLMCSELNVKIK